MALEVVGRERPGNHLELLVHVLRHGANALQLRQLSPEHLRTRAKRKNTQAKKEKKDIRCRKTCERGLKRREPKEDSNDCSIASPD